MDEWCSYLFERKRDEWVLWTRGTLEEVLGDLMDFRHGQFGDPYTQARIESPVRE